MKNILNRVCVKYHCMLAKLSKRRRLVAANSGLPTGRNEEIEKGSRSMWADKSSIPEHMLCRNFSK